MKKVHSVTIKWKKKSEHCQQYKTVPVTTVTLGSKGNLLLFCFFNWHRSRQTCLVNIIGGGLVERKDRQTETKAAH